VEGRLPEDDDGVVIGTELSLLLNARPGTTLKLISPADGRRMS